MELLDKSNEELNKIIKDARHALLIKEYKSLNIVIEEVEYKKFKKNEPLILKRIFNRWHESFIPEDSTEIFNMERNEPLGILVENKAYSNYVLEYKKELNRYNLILGNENKALTFVIKNSL